MSGNQSYDYENTSSIDLAKQAERDMNSYGNKVGVEGGRRGADSTMDSGVDESVTSKFPGATVEYGTGQGGNRTIPESEGGSENPRTGQMYKQRDFEGQGGPENQAADYAQANPGDDDVRGNIRQGGQTSRPLGGKLPNEGSRKMDYDDESSDLPGSNDDEDSYGSRGKKSHGDNENSYASGGNKSYGSGYDNSTTSGNDDDASYGGDDSYGSGATRRGYNNSSSDSYGNDDDNNDGTGYGGSGASTSGGGVPRGGNSSGGNYNTKSDSNADRYDE